VVGVGIEVLFQTLGFWHYPSVDQRYGPVLMYSLIVLMWDGYSLMGWRVMRRFGWRGETVFLAVVAVFARSAISWSLGRCLMWLSCRPGSPPC
jgi:hypothetical protein